MGLCLVYQSIKKVKYIISKCSSQKTLNRDNRYLKKFCKNASDAAARERWSFQVLIAKNAFCFALSSLQIFVFIFVIVACFYLFTFSVSFIISGWKCYFLELYSIVHYSVVCFEGSKIQFVEQSILICTFIYP